MEYKDEVVDIFDSNRNKIGTAWLWKEVHQKGLLHETIASLIFKDSSKQQVLLQKRSQYVTHDPGKWSHSGGGHLPSGMSAAEGICKEIQEELFHNHSLPNLSFKEVGIYDIQDIPGNNEFLHLFEIIYPGPVFINPDEVRTIEWKNFQKVVQDVRINPDKYTKCFQIILKNYDKNS